ncbi:MAG: 3'(2'),5'-bisphosphate nucleotidase CysQ [Humidesulfovibrio sp.]|nr:3'(2'),5'-bisphosphate nucleotidase CysQ [Humidesulfovibrio sp.]
MPRKVTVTVTARPEALLALTPILREGVGIGLRPGLSLRQTMIQDLGFCPTCVEERVQTVFLDGSPVDDIDADHATPGCTLALAGALPGVAGIAMRRGSPVGVFREGIAHDITHDIGDNSADSATGGQAAATALLPATLKLFNTVAVECLAAVLEQGVELRAGRLAELLLADPDALALACFRLNGQDMDRAGLLAALANQAGTLRLTAERCDPDSPHPDLATLASIAEAAGAAIMEVRRQGFTIQYKDDHSPLTRADLAAHETITRALAQHFPGVPVLSEEGEETPYEQRALWQRLFIVDPLDGTKEFVKELGEFCVCIALAENGFPALGAVHVPAWGKTYAGGLGLGAFRREKDGAWQAIRVRQPDPAGLTVLASRSHPSPETEAFLAGKHVAERITAGSALKFCLVAEGKADLYPRLNTGMREWDTAAGQAILEGAGGSVVALTNGQPGKRLAVNKPDLLSGTFLASAKPT